MGRSFSSTNSTDPSLFGTLSNTLISDLTLLESNNDSSTFTALISSVFFGGYPAGSIRIRLISQGIFKQAVLPRKVSRGSSSFSTIGGSHDGDCGTLSQIVEVIDNHSIEQASRSIARSARTIARSARSIARSARTIARSARTIARSAWLIARSARSLHGPLGRLHGPPGSLNALLAQLQKTPGPLKGALGRFRGGIQPSLVPDSTGLNRGPDPVGPASRETWGWGMAGKGSTAGRPIPIPCGGPVPERCEFLRWRIAALHLMLLGRQAPATKSPQ